MNESARRGLVAVALAHVAILGLSHLSDARVWSDTWFVLLYARELWAHGLPATNELTQLGHGAAWVDQQWLAHLALGGLHGVAGFAGLVIARAAIGGAALYLAMRAGASTAPASDAAMRAVVTGVVVLVLLAPHANVRAQSIAELLFAGVLWALFATPSQVSPERVTWPRVALVAVLFIGWANVHGSVLLGSALLGLHALLDRGSSLGARAVLVVVACTSPLATPHGTAIAGYYLSTVGNDALRTHMTEWSAPSPGEEPAIWAIALGGLALAIRAARSAPATRTLPVAALAVLALTGQRHATLFALALAAHGPTLLAHALPRLFSAPVPPRFARLALGAAALAAAGVVLVLAVTHDERIHAGYPAATAAHVARLAGERGLVFADEQHADRLLLDAPRLRARVAYDTRAEAVPPADLAWIAQLAAGGDPVSLARLAEQYRVVVLDREVWQDLHRAVSSDPRWSLATSDAHADVFARGE